MGNISALFINLGTVAAAAIEIVHYQTCLKKRCKRALSAVGMVSVAIQVAHDSHISKLYEQERKNSSTSARGQIYYSLILL